MSLTTDLDYGTPQRVSSTTVALEIDGIEVSVAAGPSVLRAAMEAGVNIPKLCASDNLEPFGSCRLCLVEIEGRRGYPASCTTHVAPGMKVRTQSTKLADLRRIGAGEVRCLFSCSFKVVAPIPGGSHIGEEHRHQLVTEAPHREDVVLVQAAFNLAFPQIPATEFVEISALGHEHVVGTKFDSCRYTGRDFDD